MEPKEFENQAVPNLPLFPGGPGGKKPGGGKRAALVIGAVAAALVIVLGVLLGTHVICLNHNWQEASCTEPEVCTKCGRTRGEALGHDWQEADCISPETCTRCGETQGGALGHAWEEASCLDPKTCSRCGETQGEALGHTGEWKLTTAATLNAPGVKAEVCQRCGETLDTKKVYKTPEVSTDGFNFGEIEFLEYLGKHTNESYTFSTQGLGAEDYGMEGVTGYPIYKDGSYAGAILLKSNDLDRVVGIIVSMSDEDKDITRALGMHIMDKLVSGVDDRTAAASLIRTESYTFGGVTIACGDLGGSYAAILVPEDYESQ